MSTRHFMIIPLPSVAHLFKWVSEICAESNQMHFMRGERERERVTYVHSLFICFNSVRDSLAKY